MIAIYETPQQYYGPVTSFSDFYGKPYFTEMTMIVHRLIQINKLSQITGKFKRAQDQDAAPITAWTLRFKKEANPMDRADKTEILNAVNARIADGNLFLWTDHGGPVSMAAINRKTKNVGIVGYVYSPEEHRRKGNANVLFALPVPRYLPKPLSTIVPAHPTAAED